MATAREVLALIVNADAKQAISELEKVGKTAEKEMNVAKSATDKWASRLTKGGAAAVGFAGVAGTALFTFAKKSEEARREQIKLDQTLATVPALAGANRKAFTDLADAIHKKTVVDDDQVVSAEAVLGQFGLTQDAVLKLTPLVVDLSRKMGIDLDQAAKIVGKTMAGNSGALKRVGVVLDENTFKTDRLTAVQAGLSAAVGGFAEREGKTFSGRLAILKNQLGDVEEGIGSGVTEAVSTALGPLTKLSEGFASLPPELQKTLGIVGTFGTATVGALGLGAVAAAKLISSVGVLRNAFDAYAGKKAAATGVEVANTAAVEANTAALGENAAAAGVAGTAAKTGAVGMGAFGTAAVGAGSALGALGIAFGNAKLDERASGFSTLGKAAYVLGRGFTTAIPGAQGLTSALGFLGGGHKKTSASSDELKKKTDALTNAQTDYANLIDSGKASEADLASARDKVTAASEDLTKAQSNQAATQADVNAATDAGTSATGDFAASQKKLQDELDATEKKLQDYEDAVFGTRDAARAQTEASLDLTDAIKDYADKADAARKATNDGGAAQRDATRAFDEATGAIDAVATSASENAAQQAKLKGQTLSAADAAKVQRDALIQLRDRIAPNSPLRLYLEGLIQDLDKAAQNRTGSLTVSINTTAQGPAAQRIAQSKLLEFRAAGGPVHSGQPYIVGEKGPELFVPKQSGDIIPRHTSTGVTISSGLQPITIIVQQDRTGEWAVKSIQNYNNIKGPAPIKVG